MNRCFGGTYHLHIQDRNSSEQEASALSGFLLGWFLTLKMVVICSSETSVYIRRCISEDGSFHFHNYRYENLKSYVSLEIYTKMLGRFCMTSACFEWGFISSKAKNMRKITEQYKHKIHVLNVIRYCDPCFGVSKTDRIPSQYCMNGSLELYSIFNRRIYSGLL
jgi:hypothetical protein